MTRLFFSFRGEGDVAETKRENPSFYAKQKTEPLPFNKELDFHSSNRVVSEERPQPKQPRSTARLESIW